MPCAFARSAAHRQPVRRVERRRGQRGRRELLNAGGDRETAASERASAYSLRSSGCDKVRAGTVSFRSAAHPPRMERLFMYIFIYFYCGSPPEP